ncbi:MAG: hypothetical protein ACRDLF_06850 [Solirubrobacteraceae bacterium]
MAVSAVALMASPGVGTGTTNPAPALSASVEQCVTAATQADRSVTFTGQMETIPGAHRMAMEIVVQEHGPGEVGFHTLAAAGSGTWQRSEVGLKIYKYERQVTDLPAPAGFRAIVLYRWLNERGHVIKREERRTPVCRQPAERLAPAPSPESGSTHTAPQS